jgi:microcystin-dependent protein
MADQFVGEIRLFPYNFSPSGWAFCHGQLLPISQNTALFSLLGTTYGGNGTSNFALPDLRDRTTIHFGNAAGLTPLPLGSTGGEASVTLTSATLAAHTHAMNVTAASATTSTPGANLAPARGHGQGRGAYKIRTYAPSGTLTTMAPGSIGPNGSGAAHNNVQPSLVMNWCIALVGIFPTRN